MLSESKIRRVVDKLLGEDIGPPSFKLPLEPDEYQKLISKADIRPGMTLYLPDCEDTVSALVKVLKVLEVDDTERVKLKIKFLAPTKDHPVGSTSSDCWVQADDRVVDYSS